MPVQRYLIAPFNSGLQEDKEPWLIMDDAWTILQNVHVWRGRVQKRFGASPMNTSVDEGSQQLFTRFRIELGSTNDLGDGIGDFSALPVPGAIFKVGQIFSCGTEIYTVNDVSMPQPQTLLSTGAGSATYDTTTGDFILTGGPALTPVYFYPAEPVMALPSFDRANVNDEILLGFDTQFAYTFSQSTGWRIAGPLPPAAMSGLWTGTNSDFHWATNYRGAVGSDFILFVVNGVIADQIQYFDGTNWTKFSPIYNTINLFRIRTGKIILPFKGRLLLMNTTEQTVTGDANFFNRVRFSQNGDPTISATAWDEIVVGRGGFIEASTREAIISAEFIKDRLIVFFERSVWELVYTGNEVLPFRFQKLNSDLGVESQNSVVLFDKAVLGMGSTGIHACNGMNVNRIDEEIPEEIFDISNDNFGVKRVSAIKDYFTEEVYWSFPSSTASEKNSNTFPNQILVLNYNTGSWARYDDHITSFGYYQNENDIIWSQVSATWQESAEPWDTGTDNALFRNIVAGNQQGFTFIVKTRQTKNSLALSITDIETLFIIVSIKAIDHNLVKEDFIFIENVQGTETLSNLNGFIFEVDSVQNENEFTIIVKNPSVTGDYIGGGTITHVSSISLISKRYNFFNKVGKKIQVPRIDFLVDVIPLGEVQFDYFSSFSDVSLVSEGSPTKTNANLGSNILSFNPESEFEDTQTKLWRSMYPLLEGDTIQYSLEVGANQIRNSDIAFSDFQLHAVLFFARETDDFGF